MAFTSGSAANAPAFMTEFTNFVTSNGWDQVWNSADSTEFVLRGTGTLGGHSVYVGLRMAFDNSNRVYLLFIRGLSGYTASAVELGDHPGASNEVAIFLDGEPMGYWFVANERRIIIVAKLSTVYQTAYMGLFLPYALPTTYPDPVFIAGCRGGQDPMVTTWRSTNWSHTSMLWPSSGDAIQGSNPSAWLLDPTGEWLCFPDLGGRFGDRKHCSMMPMRGGANSSMFGESLQLGDYVTNGGPIGMDNLIASLSPFLGTGGYGLIPLSPVSANYYDLALGGATTTQTFGVLDGVYACPGFDNSSENIITLNGVPHLVVQDVFRTSFSSYMAIKLG